MKTLLYITILCLLVVACSPQTPTEQTDNTAQAAEHTDDHEHVDETTGSAFEEFADLFSMKMRLEYQVDYTMTTDINGQTETMKMSQYIKGEQVRSDVMMDGMETRSYITSSSMTSCTNDGEWYCLEMEMESTPADELEEQIEINVEASEHMDVQKLPSRTIAGTTTNCFKVLTEDGDVEYCLSKEGVPLYTATRVDGNYQVVMEATSYSTSVPNSAFTPPAEPEVMPDFGNMNEDDMADFIAQYS